MNQIRKPVAQGISPLYEMGVRDERQRIIELIKGAPINFEWFQPFVGTKTLIEQINGEDNGENV